MSLLITNIRIQEMFLLRTTSSSTSTVDFHYIYETTCTSAPMKQDRFECKTALLSRLHFWNGVWSKHNWDVDCQNITESSPRFLRHFRVPVRQWGKVVYRSPGSTRTKIVSMEGYRIWWRGGRNHITWEVLSLRN